VSYLLEIRDLAKEYRLGEHKVAALREVSVDIEDGSFVAVMGPSGSGKSTFMNLIGCLDKPSAGSYRLCGEMVSELSVDALATIRNKRICFVFQNFNLLARMDAQANVELPLLYAEIPAEERKARALARLKEVGLAERTHHQPSQLSGGQQQRVAIARALVNSPQLLLADEPTGALDTRTSLEIMALFQALNRQGLTVVVVTHEADIAAFAGRVLFFRDGRLIDDKINASPRDAVAEAKEVAA
jgi:putative ABC transport system ATP-binding protein